MQWYCVDAIQHDIQWLGFQWNSIYYASDYFQQLFDLAIKLIKEGKAYVDEQSSEEIAKQKGTPTTPGIESPFRNRPIEESLRLFDKMNAGEIAEGAMVLRAKIDMASSNMHFRDPIMYRIINTRHHHRTEDKWKVYPMYDYAHGQSDFFEGVTHSICTLEFEVHPTKARVKTVSANGVLYFLFISSHPLVFLIPWPMRKWA